MVLERCRGIANANVLSEAVFLFQRHLTQTIFPALQILSLSLKVLFYKTWTVTSANK